SQIRDDEVEHLLREPFRRAGDVRRLGHAMPAFAKQEGQRRSRRGLVVDDEQVSHRHAASTGSSSVTRVPWPGSESMSILPPCAATIRSAIVSPNPLPFGLAE